LSARLILVGGAAADADPTDMHLALSHNRQSTSERNDSGNQRKSWYHTSFEILAVSRPPRLSELIFEAHTELTRRAEQCAWGARAKARHRHLHHLDRAAGESELHPHERAGPRPGNEIVGRGDEEPLVVQLALDDVSEKRIGHRASLGSKCWQNAVE
jgi:hypothetical protein